MVRLPFRNLYSPSLKNVKRPAAKTEPAGEGWRFTLKGSPRHYDDVLWIIERSGQAKVYFGEALTYERGAGVALWRVQATGFDWLPTLYEWWAEQERIEPIQFTFHLYLPNDLKYPALNLREHRPEEVATFIRERAPKSTASPPTGSRSAEGPLVRTGSGTRGRGSGG